MWFSNIFKACAVRPPDLLQTVKNAFYVSKEV